MGAMAAIGALVASNPKLFGVLFPGAGISARWISTDFGVSFLATAGIVGYLLAAISIFFNAALVRCALDCFSGREPSISVGLTAAASRLPQILGWTLLAVTVGLDDGADLHLWPDDLAHDANIVFQRIDVDLQPHRTWQAVDGLSQAAHLALGA